MHTKQVWAWALYDFANTAFSALFVTLFYPLFIKEFLLGNEFQIGLVFGLSMFFVGVSMPLIGVISDLTGKRVRLIAWFTGACVLATALVGLSTLYWALLLGFIANYCYHACLVLYNAVLPQLAHEQDQGQISGFGVAVGYFGTFASLVMAYFILSQLGWDSYYGIASIFPATAFFFLGFSMFLFRYVPDHRKRHTSSLRRLALQSFREVKYTLTHIRDYPGLLPFLLSSFCYSNGATAAIIFLYLYAREQLHVGVDTFLWIFVVFSFASAFGAYFAGVLSDKTGPKKTLVLSGLLWCTTLYILIHVDSIPLFVFAGCIGGLGLGSMWTANRPIILDLTHREKPGQFFGYNELADKFSGALAPPLFGWLVLNHGYGAGLVSLLFFFILGLGLLYFVPKAH